MSLSAATQAPITRVIDGKEYLFATYTLSMFGKLEQWVRDLIFQNGMAQAKTIDDSEIKKIIIEQTYKESINYSMGQHSIDRTFEVMYHILYLSLHKLDGSITKNAVIDLFDLIDDQQVLIKQITNQPLDEDEKKTLQAVV